jgi:DNA repair exonuclease SbcCD nuclease subunit
MRIRLLQFGDLHLDAPFTSLCDFEGRPHQRRQDLKRTLSRIIDLALSEGPDILLVCGDLYEHAYTEKSSINFVCSQFDRIADIPVLMIPGNHDPLVPGSFYSGHAWPSNVHILGAGDMFEHTSSHTRVYGAAAGVTTDPSYINILMHHGTLDMPFSANAFQPISGKEIEEQGFDYCALGHFHSRISGPGPGGICFNAGSPEPLGFDEEGDHGVLLSVIEKEREKRAVISSSFIKLCSRRAVSLEADIGGCLSNEQAAELVEAEIRKAGSSDDLFRVTLKGRIPSDIRIDPEIITEQTADKVFYIKIIDETAPDYDLEQISREQGLRGLFVRKMLERASAAGQEESRLVMQALYYGLEAIDEGKVCV